MPRAKKAIKKTTKSVAAKVSSPKKTSKVTTKKPVALKKTLQGSQALVFSSIGANVSKTAQRVVTSLKTNKKSRFILAGIVIVALFLLLIPHLVIAMVDGRPITIFSYYSELDQKYGADTKQQLVSEQLIQDEAQKRGVSVSDQEVQAQVNQIEAQASGSGNLDQILAQQGLTRDDFMKQLRLQAMIKKMFSKEASVSSAEVDQYIQNNKSQLPDPVDDKTRAGIVDQLQQQKLVQVFQSWLAQASSSNRVVKF